ncbi:MAG: hypothetical protein MZU95_04935 [Desulfomicrobium escambiense]|nr:hypothetical protein [Desulfomicrobium escambiense]
MPFSAAPGRIPRVPAAPGIPVRDERLLNRRECPHEPARPSLPRRRQDQDRPAAHPFALGRRHDRHRRRRRLGHFPSAPRRSRRAVPAPLLMLGRLGRRGHVQLLRGRGFRRARRGHARSRRHLCLSP